MEEGPVLFYVLCEVPQTHKWGVTQMFSTHHNTVQEGEDWPAINRTFGVFSTVENESKHPDGSWFSQQVPGFSPDKVPPVALWLEPRGLVLGRHAVRRERDC